MSDWIMFDPDKPLTWPKEKSQVEVLWVPGWREYNSLRFHDQYEVAREVMCFEQVDMKIDFNSRGDCAFAYNCFTGWARDAIAWRYADKLPIGLSEFLKNRLITDHIMSYDEYRESVSKLKKMRSQSYVAKKGQ